MTGAPVIVCRSGIAVDVGRVDGQPFPQEFLQFLLPKLTYDHVEFLRGSKRYMPDGSQRSVNVKTRRLYDIMDGNKIRTGFGFMPRIAAALKQFGWHFDVVDLTPPRATADAYVPRWDTLAQQNVTWRYRQLECMQTIASSPGGIISAPPAFGKTQIIGYTALLYPHARIAVVTKRKDIAQGIEQRLYAFLPMVGFFGDSKKRKARVSVFIAKSMHKATDEFDFLFVDECHEMGADTFAAQLSRTFFFSRIFGLSATWDGRADGTSARLEYMFGPVIFYMTWQEAEQNGLIVPTEVRWLNINLRRNPCDPYVSDVTREKHGIWCNEARNAEIAKAVRNHPDEQVLILVRTIEHAVHLGRHLPEFTLVYDKIKPEDLHDYKARGYLPPDYRSLETYDRQTLRGAFERHELKKVIATDVWSTGVSFEQLAVLVRADARAGAIVDDQTRGRVVRIHEESGKEKGIVYDCWDMFDKKYLGNSQKRSRRYKKEGCVQIREKVLGEQFLL